MTRAAEVVVRLPCKSRQKYVAPAPRAALATTDARRARANIWLDDATPQAFG